MEYHDFMRLLIAGMLLVYGIIELGWGGGDPSRKDQ